MPVATTRTVSLDGAVGHLVTIQADVSAGQVRTDLIGRVDQGLSEARDRHGVPIQLALETAGGACEVEFDAEWRVRLSDALLQSLGGWLGADCVKVQFRKYVPPVVERRSERAFASAGGDDE